MAEKTRVAIVNAGGHRDLSAAKGSYDTLVGSMQRQLEEAEYDGKPLMEVAVVRSTEEALAHVGHQGVIFYVTMGMADEAERVHKEYSRIRVVVLSGESWGRGVIYFPKAWVSGRTFQDIALRGY